MSCNRQRASFAWGMLLALLGATSSCAVTHTPAAAEVDLPDEGAALPARRVYDFFLVEAMLDGRGPYPLLLDTGADYLTLDSSLATHFAIGSPQVDRIRGATGDYVPVSQGATVATMRLGSMTLRRAPALFRDLSALGDTLGTPILGLLGIGLFEGTTLELDYPRDLVTVHRRPLHPEHAFGPTAAAVLPSGRASVPSVDVHIGNHSLRCLVDSGCGWAAAVPGHLGPELFTAGSVTPQQSVSLSGRHTRNEGSLRNAVRLGPFDLRAVRAVAGTGRPKLGAPLLSRFRVVFDRAHHRVGFFVDAPHRAPAGSDRD